MRIVWRGHHRSLARSLSRLSAFSGLFRTVLFVGEPYGMSKLMHRYPPDAIIFLLGRAIAGLRPAIKRKLHNHTLVHAIESSPQTFSMRSLFGKVNSISATSFGARLPSSKSQDFKPITLNLEGAMPAAVLDRPLEPGSPEQGSRISFAP